MDPLFDILASMFLAAIVLTAARYVKGQSDERHAWYTIGVDAISLGWLVFA